MPTRILIDFVRGYFNLEQKLKPIDIDRAYVHANHFSVVGELQRAVFAVAYHMARVKYSLQHEKALTVAYALSECINWINGGFSAEEIQMELTAIAPRFHMDEKDVVLITDICLSNLEVVISLHKNQSKSRHHENNQALHPFTTVSVVQDHHTPEPTTGSV